MRKASMTSVGVVLVGIAAGGYYVPREVEKHLVTDALQTAAGEILRQLHAPRETLSPEAIRQVFVTHHRASVSPIWFDGAGNPVDAWGVPFRVAYDQTRPAAWVLCESAGPDRVFGTRDDLSFRTVR